MPSRYSWKSTQHSKSQDEGSLTDFSLSAKELEVIARHQRSLGMTHQIDLGCIGRRKHLIDKSRQLGGAVLHLVQSGQQGDVLVASISQREHAVALCSESVE